jgi:hypothetical protein
MTTPLVWPWTKFSYFIMPEGPGARWGDDLYFNRYADYGMIEYRLTIAIGSDVVCLCPDGGCNKEPVPIEPSMTWDEAVTFLSRCAVAPPVKYNGDPRRPDSISFALAGETAPWHAWTGYDPERTS